MKRATQMSKSVEKIFCNTEQPEYQKEKIQQTENTQSANIEQESEIYQQPIQSELPAIDPGKKFATTAFIFGISILPVEIILISVFEIIEATTEYAYAIMRGGMITIVIIPIILSIITLIFSIIYLKKGNGMNLIKSITGMSFAIFCLVILFIMYMRGRDVYD